MSILIINDLALELVKLDFSNGHVPTNGGPTKTSRALAIIHLAAHDAYAQVSKAFTAAFPAMQKKNLPILPATLTPSDANTAMLCAGFRAATILYPDFKSFIAAEAAKVLNPDDGCCNALACKYGEQVADAWIAARMNDGSAAPQTDTLYSQEAGRHRPDLLNAAQMALGRNWGRVTPFILQSIPDDAPLAPPPSLDGLNDANIDTNSDGTKFTNYATAFKEVIKDGKNDIINRDPNKGVIGIFWGYDGANLIGVPPRLYNQVVRAIPGLEKDISHEKQIRILTAINVAMADAGIAAWHWKYQYDFWRPVVGVREADAGWGPMGKGDGNPATTGDPFWLPLGAPNSNSRNPNGTPPFPAYPSGHATFGAACFETAAKLLGKTVDNIEVEFVSDEFDGKTTDNNGVVRPKYKAKFTLRQAIIDNNISRIYLGVHWRFDAEGGEKVGNAIAVKVADAFKC